MKTLTINEEQLKTAFHMFVISNREDARVVREAAAQDGREPLASSDERVAEFGARRLWKLLDAISPTQSIQSTQSTQPQKD